ncbi:MAG: hypothetical protein AAF500_14155 [Myxococcota bacterium]
MNKGLIAGRVLHHGVGEESIVYLKELRGGSGRFPYKNKRGGRHIGPVRTKKDGTFIIPFFWNGAHLGHGIGTQLRFRVFAMHKRDSYVGSARGAMVTGVDVMQLWGKAVAGGGVSGALRLRDFPLAAAIRTAFSPKIPAENMKALGKAVIELDFP